MYCKRFVNNANFLAYGL
ncbi:hypothetical protein TSUD_30740, partial [Trifolium subterraneum]